VAALVAIFGEARLPRVERERCDPAAFERIRTQFVADVEQLWGGVFHRLGGSTADVDCALELCAWLEFTGRAYARDAEIALTPEWSRIVAARGVFLRASAADCLDLVAERSGAETPTLDDLVAPPPKLLRAA
jgi:hypothetical protein